MDNDNERPSALGDEAGVGGAPGVERTESASGQLRTTDASAITKILLIRESDAGNLFLLLGMAEQTLRHHVSRHPELKVLLADPLAPVLNPTTGSIDRRLSRTARAVMIQIESTLVIYYMGSAASRDALGESQFGSFMSELIDEHRPQELLVGPFTRLGRSMRTFTTILDPIQRNHVQVSTVEVALKPWVPSDEFLWGIFASFATQERNSIVSRTAHGKAALARRGGWYHAPWGMPFGYKLDNGTVTPDESMQHKMREALTLLADPTLSARDLVTELAELGFERRRPKSDDPNGKSIASVVDAKDLRSSILKSMSLYETGILSIKLPVALVGIQTIGDLEIVREDGADHGHVILECDWGLPEGGWASQETFDAIRAAVNERARGRRPSGNKRRPFTRTPAWHEDGYEYRIRTNDVFHYVLERRKVSLCGVEVDWEESSERQVLDSIESLGRIETNALANAVASASLAALHDPRGQAIELDVNAKLPATIARARAANLERQIHQAAELRRRHDRTRRLAAMEKDDEMAALVLADAADLLRKAKEVEAAVEAMAASDAPATIPHELVLDFSTMSAVFNVLGNTNGAVAAPVADAVQQVIQNLRIFPVKGQARAELSFVLAVPTAEGIVTRIGPIQTTVRMTPRRYATPTRTSLSTHQNQAIELLATGSTIEQVADELGAVGPARVEQLLELAALEEGATAALARRFAKAPVNELVTLLARITRASIATELTGSDRNAIRELLAQHEIADASLDLDWCAYVLDRYSNMTLVSRDWSMKNEVQQTLLNLLRVRNAPIGIQELYRTNPAMFGPKQINSLVFGRGMWPGIVDPVGELQVSSQLKRAHEANIQLKTCPHCGSGLDTTLAVHEVPSRLLCSSCRRSSELDSPTYPKSYFGLPLQSKTGRLMGRRSRIASDTARLRAEAGVENVTQRWKRRSTNDVPDETKHRVCEDYRNGIPVVGMGSITDKHAIPTTLLYRIIDEAAVPRRQTKIKRSSYT